MLGIDLHQARIAITLEYFATRFTHAERRSSPIEDANLRDDVVTRGMPLRQAAAELGIDRKRVAQRCREIGIDLSSPGRRQRWHIDPEWSREPYLERMRILRDLAQKIGCSPTSLAQRHGITLRGRGGSSHRSATLAD